MSVTPNIAALRRHLRAQERASRKEADQRARRALAFIRGRKYFLAIGELLEAEIAKAEADTMLQASQAARGT